MHPTTRLVMEAIEAEPWSTSRDLSIETGLSRVDVANALATLRNNGHVIAKPSTVRRAGCKTEFVYQVVEAGEAK